MWDNIGIKLKNLAKVTCWIGIIAFIIYGLVMLGAGNDVFISLITMILGCFASWIGSWAIYALGTITEYVENAPSAKDLKACFDILQKTKEGSGQTSEKDGNQSSSAEKTADDQKEARIMAAGAEEVPGPLSVSAAEEPAEKTKEKETVRQPIIVDEAWIDAGEMMVKCPGCNYFIGKSIIRDTNKCPKCGFEP